MSNYKLKMKKEDYFALRAALVPFLAQGQPMTERDRWDVLWRSGFDVMALYRAGLNDSHIDSALRTIVESV